MHRRGNRIVGIGGSRVGIEARVDGPDAQTRALDDLVRRAGLLGARLAAGPADDAHVAAGRFDGPRQHERHGNAEPVEAPRQAEAGGAKPAADVGRKLPAEH